MIYLFEFIIKRLVVFYIRNSKTPKGGEQEKVYIWILRQKEGKLPFKVRFVRLTTYCIYYTPFL